MPCTYETDSDVRWRLSEELKKVSAILCGVLTAAESMDALDQVFDGVDWKEAGVKRPMAEFWWREHKRADAERRARDEAQEAQRRAEYDARRVKQQHIESAKTKLTPEEQRALGIGP